MNGAGDLLNSCFTVQRWEEEERVFRRQGHLVRRKSYLQDQKEEEEREKKWEQKILSRAASATRMQSSEVRSKKSLCLCCSCSSWM